MKASRSYFDGYFPSSINDSLAAGSIFTNPLSSVDASSLFLFSIKLKYDNEKTVQFSQLSSGEKQIPEVRWLPTGLYLQPEYRDCHLLYYTGITRTAKNILSEIVCRMFLNQREQLALLREMKNHTMEMFDAIQHEDFWQMGRLVRKTWNQNQALDKGTNPAEVSRLSSLIDDLCLGYKLPGAGGGGYLYMVAKDPEAAVRIRQILSENRTNRNARFVDMLISERGLQVSRS